MQKSPIDEAIQALLHARDILMSMSLGIDIEISASAYKHGVSEADIKHTIATKLYDALINGHPEKYAAIGFDCAGNLLELMYNRIDDSTIQIFHAMKCRKSFRSILGF